MTLYVVSVFFISTWIGADCPQVDYLLKPAPTVRQPRHGAAIAILTIYASVVVLLLVIYLRLLYTVAINPGYVPRGPQWHANNSKRRKRSGSRRTKPNSYDLEKQNGGLEEPVDRNEHSSTQPYTNVPSAYGPANDVATPGLHDFYSREVFVCENDGRPNWCSTCLNWKPDRTHHCREIGRCVRKMDHFCPWYIPLSTSKNHASSGLIGNPGSGASSLRPAKSSLYNSLLWGPYTACHL